MAIKFDGADDIVKCGTGASLNNLAAITASFWMNPASDGESNSGHMLDKRGTLTNAGWQLIIRATHLLEFSVSYNSDSTSSLRQSANNAFVLNKWQHILGTWDGTTNGTGYKIYVDGVEVTYGTTTSATGTRDNDSSSQFEIGSNDPTTRTFDGLITEVAVWNTVLSSAEITELAKRIKGTPLYISPSNLKGYWPMNDKLDKVTADGQNVRDLSGNGNNGTGNDGANNTGCLFISDTIFPQVRKTLSPIGTRTCSRQAR